MKVAIFISFVFCYLYLDVAEVLLLDLKLETSVLSSVVYVGVEYNAYFCCAACWNTAFGSYKSTVCRIYCFSCLCSQLSIDPHLWLSISVQKVHV